MTEFISFDDLLDEEPDTPISIKKDKKVVKAPAIYKIAGTRDTKANWDSPTPEEIVLFWSVTKCTACGETYEHPTYAENSMLVKYRVSKYRAIMRPFYPALIGQVKDLPHVRCLTTSKVSRCSSCFDTPIIYTEKEWMEYLENNSPPAPEDFDQIPHVKPMADVDYTDLELAQMMKGK